MFENIALNVRLNNEKCCFQDLSHNTNCKKSFLQSMQVIISILKEKVAQIYYYYYSLQKMTSTD